MDIVGDRVDFKTTEGMGHDPNSKGDEAEAIRSRAPDVLVQSIKDLPGSCARGGPLKEEPEV